MEELEKLKIENGELKKKLSETIVPEPKIETSKEEGPIEPKKEEIVSEEVQEEIIVPVKEVIPEDVPKKVDILKETPKETIPKEQGIIAKLIELRKASKNHNGPWIQREIDYIIKEFQENRENKP